MSAVAFPHQELVRVAKLSSTDLERRTLVNHQQEICAYLQRRRLGESEAAMLQAFLFEEACRLEQTGPLLVRAKSFLQEYSTLFPADSILRRLIAGQRQQATYLPTCDG